MKQTESFFRKINLHIIQCDTEIQEDAVITSQDEFDKYIRHMKLRGFGGTDFRPVFSYVDKLIAENAFHNLKGMLYFTDGFGIFPKKKPNYKTAFIFVDEKIETPSVPAWAIKILLSKDDLKEIIQ